MSYTLYFDFETKDPELSEMGCCYLWNPEFQVLGMGYAIDDGDAKYTTDAREMLRLVAGSLTLVAHNAFYDLECIKYLNRILPDLAVDVKYKLIFCTRVGAVLENNIRMSHSLDYLSKTILKKEKDQSRFGRFVLQYSLPDGSKLVDFPKKYYVTDDEEYKRKTEIKYVKKATSWAMQNLDIMSQIAPDLVEEYCISDVQLTRDLHKYLLSEVDKHLYHTFSDLLKITTDMREEGVRIDLEKAKKAYKVLDEKAKKLEDEAKELGWWCNYGSNKQLSEMLLKLGISLPIKESGNYSCDKNVLGKIDHPVASHILEYRKIVKTRDDFVGMLIDKSRDGRIHGTMNVLGAKATGRFSHKLPNLAQIPSRDEEIGPMLRGLFIPEEGEYWLSGDFSAQEPRFYVDLAVRCQEVKPKYKKQRYDNVKKKWVFEDRFSTFDCPMILDLADRYREDPQLDSHTFNQNLIKRTTGIDIDRGTTKTFALGKAYGKGTKSTAEQLGISEEKSREFSKAFDKAAPYISMTSDYAQYLFITRGYISTIAGRKNRFDGVGYRAYNYRIQGSATDQTAYSMRDGYYKYNIVPKTVVHDEMNISGSREDAAKLKDIMENSMKLRIPSFTEVGIGSSWGEAK